MGFRAVALKLMRMGLTVPQPRLGHTHERLPRRK